MRIYLYIAAAYVLGAVLATSLLGQEPVKYSPVMPPVKGRIVYVTPSAYVATKAYNDRLKTPATIVVVPEPGCVSKIKVHRIKPQERYFKDYVLEPEQAPYEPSPIMFDFSKPSKPQLIINGHCK